MVIAWNTGSAATRFRHNLKLKKNKKIKKRVRAQASKRGRVGPQASKRSSIFPSGYVNWFKKKMDRDFKIG